MLKTRSLQARCFMFFLLSFLFLISTLVAGDETTQSIRGNFQGQLQRTIARYEATSVKQSKPPQCSTTHPGSLDSTLHVSREDCRGKSTRGERLDPTSLKEIPDARHDHYKDDPTPGYSSETPAVDQSTETAFLSKWSGQPDQYPEPGAFAVRGIMTDDYEQTTVTVVNASHISNEGDRYLDQVEEESNERHASRPQLHEPPTAEDEGPWEVLERRWRGEVRFQATAELLRKELSTLLNTLDSYQQSWARVRRLTENDTLPVSSGNIAAAIEMLRFARSRAPELAGGLDAFVDVVPGIMESLANQQAANFKVDLTSLEQEQTEAAAKLVNLYGVGALGGLQGDSFRKVAVMALKHGNFDAAIECLLEAKGQLLQSFEEEGAGGGVVEGDPTASEGPNEERERDKRDLEKLDGLMSSVVAIHTHALSINGRRLLQLSTTRQSFGSPTSSQNMTPPDKIHEETKPAPIVSSKSSKERGETDPNTLPSNSRRWGETNTSPSKANNSKLPRPTDTQQPVAVGVEPLLGVRYLSRVGQRGGFPGRKYQERMQIEALCRGYDIRDEVIFSSLYCHYTSANGNPWLLIGPLRNEVISLDPLITVTYDVIRRRERELLVTQLKKQRTSLQATDGSILDQLSKRVEATTGLKYSTSKETPFISQLVRPSGDAVTVSTANAGAPAGTAALAHTVVVLEEATAGGRLVFPWVGAGIGPVNCTQRTSSIANVLSEAIPPEQLSSSRSPPSDKLKGNYQRPAVDQPSSDDTSPLISLSVPVSSGDCEESATIGAVITWYPLLPSQELDHVTSHVLCPVARGQKWIISSTASYSAQWKSAPCSVNLAQKMTAWPIVF